MKINAFLRGIVDFYYFFLKYIFPQHIMVKNARPKEEKIINDIRNLFRLKEEQNDAAIKDMKHFRLKN